MRAEHACALNRRVNSALGCTKRSDMAEQGQGKRELCHVDTEDDSASDSEQHSSRTKLIADARLVVGEFQVYQEKATNLIKYRFLIM